MTPATIFLFFGAFIWADVESVSIFKEATDRYLQCISNPEANIRTFEGGDRTIYRQEFIKKDGTTNQFGNTVTDKDIVNDEDAFQPVIFKQVVTATTQSGNSDISGNQFSLGGDVGGKVGNVGIEFKGSFEAGNLQTQSDITTDTVTQSWERSFDLPPHMKVSRNMETYQAEVNFEKRNVGAGYLLVDVGNEQQWNYQQKWKQCGAAKPIKYEDKIFPEKNTYKIRMTDLLPDETWQYDPNDLNKIYLDLGEVNTVETFVRIETNVEFTDANIDMKEYCEMLDPSNKIDPVSMVNKEQNDQSNVEEKVDVKKFGIEATGYKFGDDDDDDKDKKKPNKKPKKPKQG